MATIDIDFMGFDDEQSLVSTDATNSASLISDFEPGDASVFAEPLDLGEVIIPESAAESSSAAPADAVTPVPQDIAVGDATVEDLIPDLPADDQIISIDDGAVVNDPAICRLLPEVIDGSGEPLITIDDGAFFEGSQLIATEDGTDLGGDQIITIDDGAYLSADLLEPGYESGIDFSEIPGSELDLIFTVMPVEDLSGMIAFDDPMCVICPVDPMLYANDGGDLAICVMPYDDALIVDAPVDTFVADASFSLDSAAGAAKEG